MTGTLITTTSGNQKYQKQVTYEMGITIREGRPWVSHFLSYEGTIPRTVSWHVNRQSREGGEIPAYATPERYRTKSQVAAEGQRRMDLDAMLPVETGATPAVQEPVVLETTAPVSTEGAKKE